MLSKQLNDLWLPLPACLLIEQLSQFVEQEQESANQLGFYSTIEPGVG